MSQKIESAAFLNVKCCFIFIIKISSPVICVNNIFSFSIVFVHIYNKYRFILTQQTN